jgi:hypothetical protein
MTRSTGLTNVGFMRRQLTRAMVLAATLVAAAACSSGTSPQPSPSPNYSSSYATQQQREQQLEPVIVGCFAHHGLIPAKDVAGQAWYHDGRVVVADNDFILWWRNFEGLPVKLNGTWQYLDDVVRSAANGNWPASVCGSEPSLSSTGS